MVAAAATRRPRHAGKPFIGCKLLGLQTLVAKLAKKDGVRDTARTTGLARATLARAVIEPERLDVASLQILCDHFRIELQMSML